MSLFGEAISDLYYNSLKSPFYVCDDRGEYETDLRFYLSNQPDELEYEP